MNRDIPDGVWPTMITPFTSENMIDFGALEKMIEWYIARGVTGLFAVCQSSEMFQLSLSERVELARKIVEYSRGRVPVIASGHISESPDDQLYEVQSIADTGVDAVVLVTNRFAAAAEGDDRWKIRLERLVSRVPDSVSFGFYECPFPYKRLLSPDVLRWVADLGRFKFLKDTSCDLDQIRDKIAAVAGTGLKLFNANSATLLGSLRAGAAGFSGVMANFHPELYAWLCTNWKSESGTAERLQYFLTTGSLVERVMYPMSAKYHQSLEGLGLGLWTRRMQIQDFGSADRLAVEHLRQLAETWNRELQLSRG